jgi:hypothetical protein
MSAQFPTDQTVRGGGKTCFRRWQCPEKAHRRAVGCVYRFPAPLRKNTPPNMNLITRRSFLQTSALATGAALLSRSTSSYAKTIGANDRLRIAVVGLHGRGKSHIAGWSEQKNVEIAYLIDPDQQVLDKSLANLKKSAGDKFAAKGLADLRKALEDPNLDAISVATPNHWHSLMTIWGAQAGKHVYVEKPMSHDIAEGRAAVEAQKRYGVVIQHGTQRRATRSA